VRTAGHQLLADGPNNIVGLNLVDGRKPVGSLPRTLISGKGVGPAPGLEGKEDMGVNRQAAPDPKGSPQQQRRRLGTHLKKRNPRLEVLRNLGVAVLYNVPENVDDGALEKIKGKRRLG
jgi:hypothetical protein